MSEFLTVRLSRDTKKPIPWLVWSPSQNEIIASGELSHCEQIDELTSYADQRTTILIIDSQDILIAEADIPAGASRQLDTMLPYLLEDDIAQDVDELHFSILQAKAGKAHIAAIDKAYFTHCLNMFSDAGIAIKKVLPDSLALPYVEDAITAIKINTTWFFKQSPYKSIAIEHEWLPLFQVSDWSDVEGDIPTIISYSELPEHDPNTVNWQAEEPEMVMKLLSIGAISSSINLLSGQFKPQSSILKSIKIWKHTMIAASLFLVVLTVKQFVQINQYESQILAYRTESERIFRSIFPDKNRIPTVSYLQREMENEESRLSGGSGEDSVLDWLNQLPEALQSAASIDVHSVRYDANRGEVRIEVTLDDFQAFEVVRTKLAEKFDVDQGPLDRRNEKVSGSFVLRRKS